MHVAIQIDSSLVWGLTNRMPVAVLFIFAAAAVAGADVLGAVDGVVVEDGDAAVGPRQRGRRRRARLGAGRLAAGPVAVVQAVALEGARPLIACMAE